MKKMIELTLPEFAFLQGFGDDELRGRDIITHIRSASVMEVFETGQAWFNEDTLTLSFNRFNHIIETKTGVECEEKFVMALHSSPLLDIKADKDMILNDIMKPAAMWYCDYCRFMDNLCNELEQIK